jgi:aspartate/methionine/tyrosine aminotransferase
MTRMLELVKEHDVRPDAVARVRVKTREGTYRTLFHHHPRQALESKFSLEFCLATLLLERNLGLQHIDDAFVARLVSEHGVVVIPMYDFYPADARQRNPQAGLDQLRLSFCFTESVGQRRAADLKAAVDAFADAALAEAGVRR